MCRQMNSGREGEGGRRREGAGGGREGGRGREEGERGRVRCDHVVYLCQCSSPVCSRGAGCCLSLT